MIDQDVGKDSRDSIHGYISRWLLGGGALAAAILLAGLGISASTVQAQVGRIHFGSIDVVDENCGGGTIDVSQSADGMSIVLVAVDQTKADGSPISGTGVFDPGAVPIGADSSFSTTFDASDVPTPDGVSPPNGVAGHTITVTGTFTGDTVTGTVNVSPSNCGNVPFSAQTPPTEAPPPPAGALIFEGQFEPIFDFLPQPDGDGVPDCGGVDIIITVTPDRKVIFSLELIGNTIGGVPVTTGVTFQPGESSVDQNGNFSTVTLTPGFSTTNQGKFDFDAAPQTVSGTVTTFPTADPSFIVCEQDYTATHQVEAVALPPTGFGGPTAGNSMTPWLALVAALGALTVAAGLALRRRA